MLRLLLAFVFLVPYALAQCTGCKPVTEYCDKHQADGRGRCESCQRLCFPGQGNEDICRRRCPAFLRSGAAVYVEPGQAALALSRSNAQAVSALNVSKKSEVEHNRNSSLHADKNIQAIHSLVNGMAPITVVSIVLAMVLAILFSILVVCLYIKCRRSRRQKQDIEECNDQELRAPINATEEEAKDQPAEICTGQQNPAHPTGVADDLHPNQKKSGQRPQARDKSNNEIVPSGRKFSYQKRQQMIPEDH